MKRSSTRERGVVQAYPALRGSWLGVLPGAVLVAACGSAGDGAVLYEPWIAGPGPRQPAFLAFYASFDGRGPAPIGAPGFPKLLSQTGAFADVERLEPVSGIVPYEIQVPLWSDGADKQRWLSVPEGETIAYSEAEPLGIPVGSVFVKHFEMALDERSPEQRRRLETRFWVAARADAQYGVTYRWNAEQTDAELVIASQTEELTIIGADGAERTQPYFFPGPGACQTCHNGPAGFVLGVRTAQLNREVTYRVDRPPVDQLSAWSTWGLIDRNVDSSITALAPRLPAVSDDAASLEDRVRAYWEGNCAMCHRGADGSVPGWDARYATALAAQGLDDAPREPSGPASRLIAPGLPEQSLIYLRGSTNDLPMAMPPLGRNRIDEAYLDMLGRWIASLSPAP